MNQKYNDHSVARGTQTIDMNRERLAKHIETVTRRMNAATTQNGARRQRRGKGPK